MWQIGSNLFISANVQVSKRSIPPFQTMGSSCLWIHCFLPFSKWIITITQQMCGVSWLAHACTSWHLNWRWKSILVRKVTLASLAMYFSSREHSLHSHYCQSILVRKVHSFHHFAFYDSTSLTCATLPLAFSSNSEGNSSGWQLLW